MHSVLIHPACDLTEVEHLRKRFSLVLRHLAAHGRPSVAKPCTDEVNRGWRRTPMGGNNGNHFYLWWAPQGTPKTKDASFPEGSIVVRDIRHHDDHTPLDAGFYSDYLHHQTSQDFEGGDFHGSPWTEKQLQFAQSTSPVRIVLGPPGSGKTFALWKAAIPQPGQRVLYLTWSADLARTAAEHFSAFAPEGSVVSKDYATFLGEICGRDIPKPSAHARVRFRQVTNRLERSTLGPWAEAEDALFCEIRGVLFGGIIPGHSKTDCRAGLTRLSDEDYRERREHGSRIDGRAVTSLLHTIRSIETHIVAGDPEYPSLSQFFPELEAAWEAVSLLQKQGAPQVLEGFDRVVVDEVQDLCVLEAAVVLELCLALKKSGGRLPELLIAGDEAQTVRPSAFDWASIKRLLSRLGFPKPLELQLSENLRSPARIAEVVDRASAFYDKLNRSEKPRGQCAAEGQCMEARIAHVRCSRSEAEEGLAQLESLPGVVLITADEVVPHWIPESLGKAVLTPAQAKGMEYQTVCVVDPGSALRRLQKLLEQRPPVGADLTAHEARLRIDQLRVALSRATETLVFLDTTQVPETIALSRNIIGNAAPFSISDLLAELAQTDHDADSDVQSRTANALKLLEDAPERAWQLARQAVCLLGDPALPNGVADQGTRRRAHSTLLAVCAHLLLSPENVAALREEAVTFASEVMNDLAPRGSVTGYGSEPAGDRVAFEALKAWVADRQISPCALLTAAVAEGAHRDWLPGALAPISQELRKALGAAAAAPSSARLFIGDVPGWLVLTGFATGSAATDEEARRLRGIAFDTLLDARRFSDAEAILGLLEPEDLLRKARMHEARGLHREAASLFATIPAVGDALRNWRAAGCWEEALALAAGPERASLTWLRDLGRMLEQKPGGELTPGEIARLASLYHAACGS